MTDIHASAPHWHGGSSVTAMMLRVIVALIPAAVFHVWYFGIGLVLNMTIAVAVALAAEALALAARRRPVADGLRDCSALVTAVLFAFAVPPLTPWWITALGVAFAIVVAKHVYGGLGCNLFNPAMAGYLVVLVSFPEALTRWPLPAMSDIDLQRAGLLDTLDYFLTGTLGPQLTWDALTGATPLDRLQTELGQMRRMPEITAHPVFGSLGAHGWEWINLGALAGGLWLLKERVIQWHIPVSMLGALFCAAAVFSIIDADVHPSPILELVAGSAMFAAFFIATDPVSAAATPRGRLLYGAGIGVLTYVLRRWGSYPEGVAFAVILMNLSVPLIDRFTRTRIYGH